MLLKVVFKKFSLLRTKAEVVATLGFLRASDCRTVSMGDLYCGVAFVLTKLRNLGIRFKAGHQTLKEQGFDVNHELEGGIFLLEYYCRTYKRIFYTCTRRLGLDC